MIQLIKLKIINNNFYNNILIKLYTIFKIISNNKYLVKYIYMRNSKSKSKSKSKSSN